MTFIEAKQKLKDIAQGEYCSIRYELQISKTNKEIPSCGLYIHNFGWHDGPDWEYAFKSLEVSNSENVLNGAPK